MSEMNRRDFLKVLGVTSTATAAGCNYLDPRSPYEHVMPYVVVLVMLTIKPTGLFGERVRKKV